ncbi:MAG: protein tyrosine phosphatase [Pseudolabrys sp.]|jgi:predicted protein tyrosine phosphatase|nr:protein tyrosine phosphatase [Pseudolabrys sp.]
MIHVCPLALLHQTVETVGARHVVTLMRKTDIIVRPETIVETNHLVLSMDDISEPVDGYVLPGEEHVARLVDFVGSWDRKTPLVVHCYAGISRSTAAAFVSACALNPQRDEAAIATAIRQASPTASPNRRIVSLADTFLGRKGRMIHAIEAIGPAQAAYEGVPFRLDLR